MSALLDYLLDPNPDQNPYHLEPLDVKHNLNSSGSSLTNTRGKSSWWVRCSCGIGVGDDDASLPLPPYKETIQRLAEAHSQQRVLF